jgi:hypothetical protein
MHQRRVLTESDVVFMYPPRDAATVRAYRATVLAWGGAHSWEKVEAYRALGVHPTGTMWCLTAGGYVLSHHPELAEGVVRDITGVPIEVPWLPEGREKGTPNLWGCFNHPAYRAFLRKKVRECMDGGALGLHVDDHLGTAHPAISYGGCFCDFCIAAFRTFLKTVQADVLAAAGVGDVETFDYRTLVRRHAATREDYLKVQESIPLHREFIEFHLREAARNVRELHALAEEVVGRPVSLSANTGLPWTPHMMVTPYLTYLVGEVEQKAEGELDGAGAVSAYRLAVALGKPMAATASGLDWAYVKKHHLVNRVLYWIAQSYACGQRLMTPEKAWCYTPGVGSDYYHGKTDVYAPYYRFVRENAALFDGYRAVRPPLVVLFNPPLDFYGGGRMSRLMTQLAERNVPFDVLLSPNDWDLGEPDSLPGNCSHYRYIMKDDRDTVRVDHPGLIEVPDQADPESLCPGGAAAPWRSSAPVWLFPRVKAGAPPVLHVLNRAFDASCDRFETQRDIVVHIDPQDDFQSVTKAVLHRPGGPSLPVTVEQGPQGLTLRIPELAIWGVVEMGF